MSLRSHFMHHSAFAPTRVDGADCRGHDDHHQPSAVVKKRNRQSRSEGRGSGAFSTSEHTAQVLVLKEVARRGVPGILVFAVPNAGRRSMHLAQVMKAEGMRAGVADLVFTIPPLGRAAYLEMKKSKGGVVADEQKRFARDAIAAGALHAVAKGYQQAVEILEDWGVLA